MAATTQESTHELGLLQDSIPSITRSHCRGLSSAAAATTNWDASSSSTHGSGSFEAFMSPLHIAPLEDTCEPIHLTHFAQLMRARDTAEHVLHTSGIFRRRYGSVSLLPCLPLNLDTLAVQYTHCMAMIEETACKGKEQNCRYTAI